MNVTKNRNPGVVNFGPFQIQPPDQAAKLFRKILRLTQQPDLRGRGECLAGLPSRLGGCRFGKNSGMGDHGVKLVQTGPGNGPAGSAGRELFQALPARLVPHRIRPMGIDQQIGVDRNQSQAG